MTAVAPRACLDHLWRELGGDAEAVEAVELTGVDPALPSSFAVGTAAQATIAASALAAAELWRLRGGRRQAIAVDLRAAAVEFRGERYLRVDGRPAPEFHDPITGLYRCGNGGWVRIHANFPLHRDGALRLLGCAHGRAAVSAALARWDALAFEDAAALANLAVTALRSFDQWDAHPQGVAVSGLPLLTIERSGDAPPQPLASAARPLAGVRVLDLTRVIAGPVCGRTLAGHGADVLLVTAAHLPAIAGLVIATGPGKLACHLDLRAAADRETFRSLLRSADVLVQGYRPGALAALGFGADEAMALRPGIVCVSLSAYGHAGPWAGRRGYDSLVQTASGFNVAEAEAAGSDLPRPLPAQAIDWSTGYLMAAAVMAALARRATAGGSWHIRCSLAQTGRWLRSLGRIEGGTALADPTQDDVRDRTESLDSGFGRLTMIRPATRMSATPFGWTRPAMPLGSHAPAWPIAAPAKAANGVKDQWRRAIDDVLGSLGDG